MYVEDQVIFQQNGATLHYAKAVRDYLNETYSDRRIGRRGAIEWSVRSPHLSSFTQPVSLEELHDPIH